MGFAADRVQSKYINSDLTCPLCLRVMDKMVTISDCQHVFCAGCLVENLKNHAPSKVCPSCFACARELEPAPPEKRIKHNKMMVKCAFRRNGCDKTLRACELDAHEEICVYNNIQLINCPDGCGRLIRKDKFDQHFCRNGLEVQIRSIVELLEILNSKMNTNLQVLTNDFKGFPTPTPTFFRKVVLESIKKIMVSFNIFDSESQQEFRRESEEFEKNTSDFERISSRLGRDSTELGRESVELPRDSSRLGRESSQLDRESAELPRDSVEPRIDSAELPRSPQPGTSKN